MDFDGVTHFTANDGSKYAEPQGLRFNRRECFIGVFDKTGLFPASVAGIGWRNRGSIEQVAPRGRVVPHHVFSSDVVMSLLRRSSSLWRACSFFTGRRLFGGSGILCALS